LSVKTSEDEIYYKNAPPALLSKDDSSTVGTTSAAKVSVPEFSTKAPEKIDLPLGKGVPAFKLAPTEDAPVNAEDIVLTIVAQKLKKPIKDVSTDSTIKVLVGGMKAVCFLFHAAGLILSFRALNSGKRDRGGSFE